MYILLCLDLVSVPAGSTPGGALPSIPLSFSLAIYMFPTEKPLESFFCPIMANVSPATGIIRSGG